MTALPRLLAALLLCAAVQVATAQSEAPLLSRIRMATIGSSDISGSATLYREQLDYRIIESGRVSASLAASWGAPAMHGRPYHLLQGASGDDVYLRLVESSPAPGYRAMTSSGWNATEMLVCDPDATHERLLGSTFTHIGGPAYLGVSDTIRAVQFRGPAQEVFYFTADLGEGESPLLAPRRCAARPENSSS